jgi:hypothetical protein
MWPGCDPPAGFFKLYHRQRLSIYSFVESSSTVRHIRFLMSMLLIYQLTRFDLCLLELLIHLIQSHFKINILNYLIKKFKTVVLSLSFDTFVALIPVSPFTGLKVKNSSSFNSSIHMNVSGCDPPAGVFFSLTIAKASPFTRL